MTGMEPKMTVTADFIEAVRDFSMMIDRKYPSKPLLKLIGDRYQLNRQQRDTISRGISSRQLSKLRKNKRIESLAFPEKRTLHVDFYNVFYTLLNYLNGKPLFISSDTFVRDSGAAYGKRIANPAEQERIIHLIYQFIMSHSIQQVIFYLDSPIPFSGELAAQLNRQSCNLAVNSEAMTCRSPDYKLKHTKSGLNASADSIVIEKSMVPVFDLAAAILIDEFNANILDLNSLLHS